MKPEYEPQTAEQAIGYLVEECGEVQAAAGKTLRWGLESFNPELPEHERETNREWLLREMVDVEGAVARLRRIIAPITSHKATLWEAINAYVSACGGDPDKHIHGNTARQQAVVAVERAVGQLVVSEAP
jgi:hypothetical protein